jgi:hypothetical protein
LNDIDVVVAGPEAILPGVSERFLVHHFHPTREKGNVLLQLVEPRSRTRIDVFSARSETIAERGGEIRILGQDRLVVSAEDLAARLLGIVAIVLDGKTVDPKYADSLERLLEIVDRDSVDRLWLEYRWGRYNEDFWTTADRVKEAIGACGSLLAPVEYSQDLDSDCSWCVGSADLPRADVKEIHRLLGYV